MQLNEAQLAHHGDVFGTFIIQEEAAYIPDHVFYEIVVRRYRRSLAFNSLTERLFREDRLAKSALARPIAKRIREICEERRQMVLVQREMASWWPAIREWNRTQRPLWDLRRLLHAPDIFVPRSDKAAE